MDITISEIDYKDPMTFFDIEKVMGKVISKEQKSNSLKQEMQVVDLSFVNRSDLLARMKEGDKDYKSMLPCYYVEISDEVKEGT